MHKKDKVITKKENSNYKSDKYLWQFIGILLGGIFGWLSGYGFGKLLFAGDNSAFIVIIIFAFLAIPFGCAIGFIIARIIFERRYSSHSENPH